MRHASDYLTLLQLAVTLNLVVGAYSSYRKGIEADIGAELDLHREKMDEIIAVSDELPSEIKQGLEQQPVKTLSDRELSRYLGDVSIRFHRKVYKFARRDRLVEPFLMPIGVFSLMLLLYASWWPKTNVSYRAVYSLSIITLLPAIWSYVRLLRETREHGSFYHRKVNDTYIEKSSEGHSKRLRSLPLEGEISRALNAVRIRYKSHLNKKR